MGWPKGVDSGDLDPTDIGDIDSDGNPINQESLRRSECGELLNLLKKDVTRGYKNQ